MRNWEFHKLPIDYDPLANIHGKDKPSDIDLAYIGKDNTLVLGEFKNETHPYIDDGQKRIIERYIKGWKHDAIAFLAVHDKYVQNGDTIVNGAECFVKEIYYKAVGAWVQPRKPTKVKQIIEYYRGGNT